VLLEAAVFCVYRLERAATAHETRRSAPATRVGGGAFAALPALVRSPYLLGIAAWISLQSFCATILYFEQIHLVAADVHGAGAQTRIFASIDLAVNVLTLVTQIFATGQLLKRFGTGATAAALPAIYVVGFLAIFFVPTLVVVLIVQVAQRWLHFAVAAPARQVFYTVLGREEKYKAKNLIDVVIYRGSDALYGWVFDSLQALGLKLGGIALVAGPVAAVWLAVSAVLGRAQEKRAAALDEARADIARLEALAEKAYDDMYETRYPTGLYSDMKDCFIDAIGIAERAGLDAEAKRLTARLEHCRAVYRSQFI
jgi:AAA family ATP:ADP antiporter